MSERPPSPADKGYYFLLRNNDIKIIRYTLEDNGFKDINDTKSKDWTIFWQVGAIKKPVYEALTRYQKVNHFPFSFYITRKDLMYRQVAKMQEIHGAKNFGWIPKTYILPNEYMHLET